MSPFVNDHIQLSVDAQGITWAALNQAQASTNTLGAAFRGAISSLLDHFEAQPPKAVIFHSAKDVGFIMGADIHEFGTLSNEAEAKALVKQGYDLMDRLAAVKYPTLALIKGYALGGGLEFALACRYRIAVDTPQTKMGLPEVMLGIVPGWGGMYRLPDLVGAAQALPMLLAGKQLDARKAKKAGLVDMAVPPRVMLDSARGLILKAPAPRELPFFQRLLLKAPLKGIVAAQARKATIKKVSPEHYPAPFAILDMFAKHNGNPFGPKDSEPTSLLAIGQHPTTKNLLRVYGLQERLKGLAKSDSAFDKVQHVHVVGAGVMGGDIAAWCALRGLRVSLQDTRVERIAPAIARAHTLFEKRIKDERLRRDAQDRLQADPAGNGITKADLIIEAIFENLEAKQALFKQLETRAKPSCLLATNTSSIPLEQIATALTVPQRLVGIHFFNPVASMMLVEIVQGASTDALVAQRAIGFVKQIDKLPLPVKSAPGFLVNRLLAPYLLEAMRCVEEGLSPETVDATALAFGMPMGPIELADTVGLDVGLAVGKTVGADVQPPAKLAALVADKKLGKKSGQGYYTWIKGKAQKGQAGTVPAGLAKRLIQPFLDQANSALAEGIVADKDLLDAGAIFGCGFAPFRGGPMQYQSQLA
jgi:3-hydroxyacyl-CoA dehydrogenase / enoyl-CoA hydratase / 3-hydroxybutyryl-CoA epimerase